MNEIINGKIIGFTLPEVIWMCTSLRKSGILRLTSPHGNGHIGFNDGYIVDILCPDAPKLGELLIKHNFLTLEILLPVLEEQSASVRRKFVGELLIEKGLTKSDTIRTMLEIQAYQALKIFSDWRFVLYEFSPNELRSNENLSISFIGVEPFQILQMLNSQPS